jgi:hypothetical protein
MENMEGSSLFRKSLYIAVSLVFLFMIFYTIMALLSPSKKTAEIKHEFAFQQPEKLKTDERIFQDSAFISINREKSFYQARVIMAESDSICLALNLHDSTATLEINGVAVHKAKLSEINISKVLRDADDYSVTAMMATPFTIENDYSTIRKEPVMIKMAPKDTSEYKPDILPDTTRAEAVNYMFEMNNSIRLYVYQNDDIHDGGYKVFRFDMDDRLRNIGDNLKSMIRMKVPEYHPAIKIVMQKSDVRIIYRALPKHGQIALFI